MCVCPILICLTRPHLSEVQTHLFAVEDALVQLLTSLRRGKGLCEVDAHTPETLEELERCAGIEGQEQGFKLCLEIHNSHTHTHTHTRGTDRNEHLNQ